MRKRRLLCNTGLPKEKPHSNVLVTSDVPSAAASGDAANFFCSGGAAVADSRRYRMAGSGRTRIRAVSGFWALRPVVFLCRGMFDSLSPSLPALRSFCIFGCDAELRRSYDRDGRGSLF